MKYLVVGDIHIGKKFNSYKVNTFNDSMVNVKYEWTRSTISHIVSVVKYIIDNNMKLDNVVFLGDIYDKSILDTEKDINSFLYLIEFILSNFRDINIDIIVGNHDTNKPQDKYENLLSVYNCCNNIRVFNEYFIENNVIYLPYYKRDNIVNILNEIHNKYNIKNPLIFSHNDFYIQDIFINTPMISMLKFKDVFGEDTVIINGHIHNSYYNEIENGIILTGSVSPTSFKDNIYGSGVFYFSIDNNNINNYKIFNNNNIFFITVDKLLYIDKLKNYLNSIRKVNGKVIVRFFSEYKEIYKDILKEYNDIIIAYVFEDNKEHVNIDNKKLKEISNNIKNIIIDNYNDNNIINLFREYVKAKYNFDIKNI